MSNPTINFIQDKVNELKTQVAQIQSIIAQRQAVAQASANGPTQTLENRFRENLPLWMQPGNVGEINRVVWPFWYTTSRVVVNPDQTLDASFSVTLEAGFVAVAYTKAVFLRTEGPLKYSYLDPEFPLGGGKTPGLSVAFRDSSSTRSFSSNAFDLDGVGNPRFPTFLPVPQLMLPNANLQVRFTNSDPTNVYVPFITFYGVRVPISQEVLSTTTI